MNCKSCGRANPEYATKCHHCYGDTGYHLRSKTIPSSDMYGNPILEVEPNLEKEKVRGKYLNTLPEYIKQKENQREMTKKILLLIGGMFGGILLLALCEFGCVLLSFVLPFIGIPLFIILLAGFATFAILGFRKVFKDMKPKEALDKQLQFHDNKHRYYVSNHVFGFSILDHTTRNDDSTTYYYAFYEIDKRNIRAFTYDSRYGEYIVLTHKPVYMHYGFPPTNEFRIPDVFDDNTLPSIFGCDMPARNIPF
jgi:hypothetical protein